jgi:hypothetical protein
MRQILLELHLLSLDAPKTQKEAPAGERRHRGPNLFNC